MKTSLALVGTIAIVGAAHAGPQEANEPASRSVVTLKVSGMRCHMCAATVERAAKKLDGVIAVTANQPQGSAEVTYDAARTSPEDIARLLTAKSGFRSEAPKPRK